MTQKEILFEISVYEKAIDICRAWHAKSISPPETTNHMTKMLSKDLFRLQYLLSQKLKDEKKKQMDKT